MITRAHVIEGSAADAYRLGTLTLRLLAKTDQTNGAFALGEFSGGEGPWTVPHVHEKSEESFYVLDGMFTFSLAEDEVKAGPGAFILVPHGVRHEMRAGAGGGRLLTLWTPGGLEAMFVELSRLPADSVRDPATRKLMSARFDSIPT